jgi:hypothetical protein
LRICTICANPSRADIDAALVAGGSLRDISGRFGLSRSAVHRHQEHVPRSLATAKEARQVAEARSLLGRIETLISDCRTIAQKAQRAREWHAAVRALGEVRSCLELLGQISGELKKQDAAVTVNVNLARRALFVQMSRGEMEAYARDGSLPEWWPKEGDGGQQTLQ